MNSLQAKRTKQAYLYSPQGLAALRDVQEDSFGNLQRSAWRYTVQRVRSSVNIERPSAHLALCSLHGCGNVKNLLCYGAHKCCTNEIGST